LDESVEVLLFTPPAAVVVEADLSAIELTHGWIAPVGQLNAEASDLAAEQSVGALDGLWQPEAITRRTNRDRITHFGLDFHDVTHS